MSITEKRTEIILNALFEKYGADIALQYGEPGYDSAEKGIIFCNWNDVPELVFDYLEQVGYELEWADEWLIDHDSGKAYRTSPDCYGWAQQWRIVDGEIITPDDTVETWIDYAEITDHAQQIESMPSFIDMTKTEYHLVNCNYESGFYPGHNDSAEELARHFLGLSGVESMIFQIDSTGQFDTHFSVWLKVDYDEITDELKALLITC